MSRRMTILLFAVVAAQVIGLVVFASVRQVALTQGREVTLQTVPVDPRSLLQGDYAILDYEIAELHEWLRDRPVGSEVFVVLRGCGDVWCGSEQSPRQPEPPKVYIRGRIDDRGRIDFRIGTFFVQEGTGHIIENARDVKVVVSLSAEGRAVIKQVLVDGRPFDFVQRDGSTGSP